MATVVTLKGIKNIHELKFEIPAPGAYLLTGSNGSGKTSLLTCLSRLRNGNAFQRGFRSSTHQSLDSHKGASVCYEFDGSSVTYTYGEERWAPAPRKRSDLLTKCGYPEVTYVAADGSRVEPLKDEFAPRSVRQLPQELRESMNRIFDTQRFDELCYLNLNRGGRNKAYLIRKPGRNATYYSERNFSLGELSILKLLIKLKDIQDKSLVLIDELELAVHPRAQVRLFNYLAEVAVNKRLTIIFSTHSVTLIKCIKRQKILFLDRQADGVIKCVKGCYPTFALGHITAGEEVAPDCVIYVEDDSARKCVAAMLDLYRASVSVQVAQPLVACASIGGFIQILDFMDKAPQMLPRTTKVCAFLDRDVKDESLSDYQSRGDHQRLALFQRLDRQIKYLPWTPEVGLVELILADRTDSERRLKEFFSEPRLVVPESWASGTAGLIGKPLRDACKTAVHDLCVLIEALTGKVRDRVREDLMTFLVRRANQLNGGALVRLVGEAIHT